MGILKIFKKEEEKTEAVKKPVEKIEDQAKEKSAKPIDKKENKKPTPEKRATSEAKDKIKGKSKIAYQTLIKPLVTEKAAELGAASKYVFAINPKMNKVEVKKAIRTIYGVEPIKVNISNVSGKKVRYGRVWGKTKDRKKAIVTLKSGDKIEIYEGV